jgi:hypothetical protein
MVTGYLLLLGTDRVGLHVRVQESSSVSHVLEREARSEGGFCDGGEPGGQREQLRSSGSRSESLPRGF